MEVLNDRQSIGDSSVGSSPFVVLRMFIVHRGKSAGGLNNSNF